MRKKLTQNPLKKFHNRADTNEAIALKMSFAKCIKRDGKNYNKKMKKKIKDLYQVQ